MTDPFNSRLALDALPQLVFGASADGTMEYMNRRCAEYTGLPLDDLLGWDWAWVIHPTDLPVTMTAWGESIRTGSPRDVEHRLRRHDGTYRWFLSRAEPVRDDDGRVVRWFGTATDIDESKRLADELRAVRTLFRALVERGEDGLALVGADGTVRFANAAAVRLLDLAADELTGTDLWGSVRPADGAALRDWLDRVLSAPGQRLVAALHFTRPGRSPRHLEVSGTNLLRDPDVRAVAVRLRPIGAGG